MNFRKTGRKVPITWMLSNTRDRKKEYRCIALREWVPVCVGKYLELFRFIGLRTGVRLALTSDFFVVISYILFHFQKNKTKVCFHQRIVNDCLIPNEKKKCGDMMFRTLNSKNKWAMRKKEVCFFWFSKERRNSFHSDQYKFIGKKNC
jgi:hypothetical protein